MRCMSACFALLRVLRGQRVHRRRWSRSRTGQRERRSLDVVINVAFNRFRDAGPKQSLRRAGFAVGEQLTYVLSLEVQKAAGWISHRDRGDAELHMAAICQA